MKKEMTAILFGAAMLTVATLTGANFRVDLQVYKNTCGLKFKEASEGVRGEKASWMKEKAHCRLMVMGKSEENWKEKRFQFTADEDCLISLEFMANPDRKKRPWIAYDNVRIEGAEIKNGSFEQINPKRGLPGNWSTFPKTKMVLKTGDDAADGKNYVETTHDHRAMQLIKCKKDVPVTITFMVRDAKRTTEVK